MNRDLIILLKSIYENSNERRQHHIIKLDEIIAAFNQNKLKVEKMMAVEEGLLKDKVSQT